MANNTAELLQESATLRHDEKLKVLFLSPVGFFKGGAERSLQDLLANPYITPFIMAPDEGSILETARSKFIQGQVLDFGNINTIRRPFSFSKGLGVLISLYKAASDLKRYCKVHKIKAVHSNGLKAHMINVVSRTLGGAPAIIHIRDIPYTRAERVVWHIMHFLCDRMILVSAPCWPGKNLPHKAVVIHNGIDVKGHLPKIVPSALVSTSLTIGFAGRIHPAKGLHLLLDWFAKAVKNGNCLKLSIRGSFSDEVPEYELQIKNQCKRLNIEEYIEFTGHISDPALVYKDLDVVVVPSETPDPLPRSVMEAMAQGLIVFGYPAGGILDMIEDGTTGFLVNNEAGFCQAIDQIKNNPARRIEISIQAREKMMKEFTISNLHDKVYKAYSNYK